MKAIKIAFLFFLSILFTPLSAQIKGEFVLGDDEEIYFQCNNGSGYNIPSIAVVLISKSGLQLTLNSESWWNNNTTFWIGPNFDWNWKKGDQAYLYVTTYNSFGYPTTNLFNYWICPTDKPTTWNKAKDLWDKKPEVKVRGLGKGWGNKAMKFLKKVR